MQVAPTETEVKFHVERLAQVSRRLADLGAVIRCGRVLEQNLRFDTPERRLEGEHRALRLRRDTRSTLTYKGPSILQDGIRSRTELEIGVEDFARARQLLEALGYVVTFEYEKFRTTYALAEMSIMLDELPYGDFVEIEGDAQTIKVTARQLGLRWELAVLDSYLGLFGKLKARDGLPFLNLRFNDFSGVSAHVRDLGIEAADA